MKNKKIKFLIYSLITCLVVLLIGLGIYFIRVSNDASNGDSWEVHLIRNLIDGFGVSGLLGILFFLLIWVSNEGAFDILAYSFKLVWYNTFRRNIRETALPKNYAEYKALRHSKEKMSTSFILVGSLPSLITALILLISYNLH